MNFMKNDRMRQYLMSYAQHLIPWREPILVSGPGSFSKIPNLIRENGFDRVFIVTTNVFVKRRNLEILLIGLINNHVEYVVFDEVEPDPTIECIDKAEKLYRNFSCKAIIAVGGGSVIDCAKVTGARIAKTQQTVIQMTGLFKIRKKIPMLFAVPTTAGTGSEVTVSAVVTDSKMHYKYPINDKCLIPKYAILDPELTLSMPKELTASTGMDALTHAIEAFTNKFSAMDSKTYALKSVTMIFDNLLDAYDDGSQLEKREKMLKAFYHAIIAFTNGYVGYVHDIAHGVGGLYGVAQGYANAVILPTVLKAYDDAVHIELAESADAVGISGKSNEEKAKNLLKLLKK